jgi:hypothetical protein
LQDINIYNNFTDLLYPIRSMKFTQQFVVIVGIVFLFSVVFSSCASRKRENTCRANNTYHNYSKKKNKSRYNQKYVSKSKSVRKDYVIKNGIAR